MGTRSGVVLRPDPFLEGRVGCVFRITSIYPSSGISWRSGKMALMTHMLQGSQAKDIRATRDAERRAAQAGLCSCSL